MVQRTNTASGLVPPRACSHLSVSKAGTQLASPAGFVPLDAEGKLVGVACPGGAGQAVRVTATEVVPVGAPA